jgi:hypothetical protein
LKRREPLTKRHDVASQKTRIQRMRRVAHLVCMGEIWNVCLILARNPKRRHHSENLNVGGRVVGPVKIQPETRGGGGRRDFSAWGQEPVAGSCDTAGNLWFHWKVENLFGTWAVSLSRRILVRHIRYSRSNFRRR